MVVIGAGFAGLSAAKSLSCMPVALTIIDQRNHHLFQPLLYQVAMAGLSQADIATPIRGLFSGQRNVRVLLDQVTGVDTQAHEVLMDDKRVPFDVLIVSTGAFAPGLKQIEDAIAIRRRILIAFEHAEAEEDADERRRLLTLAVIGAGATGVELAGAIAELAKVALAKDFRTINPRDARIVLIGASDRVLPGSPASLSLAAHDSLTALGVEVRTGAAVTDCTAKDVAVGDERIAAGTILWPAGVMASPAARWLHAAHDRAGRVTVEPRPDPAWSPRCLRHRRYRLLCWDPTASRCRAWRRWQSSRACTWRSRSALAWPARRSHHSAIAPSAALPRSDEVAPSPTLGGYDYRDGWHGCCGASSTSPS